MIYTDRECIIICTFIRCMAPDDSFWMKAVGVTFLRKNLYILNVINILVYINSFSSASVMLCCVVVHSVI